MADKTQSPDHLSMRDRAARAFHHPGRIVRCILYNRFLAAAVIAFAVSWGFHLVEKQTDEKLLHQDRVIVCVIENSHGQIKTSGKVSKTSELFRICERKVIDRYEK